LGSTGNFITAAFYAKNTSANASDVVTATYSANTSYTWLSCRQYSGANTSSPLDTSAIGANSSQVCGANSMSTGTFTTTAVNEVLVGGFYIQLTSSTPFVGSGYTLGNSTSDYSLWTEDQLTSSIQTGVTATFGTTACNYFQGIVVTLKAATGATSTISPMDVMVVR
jgi:hypothetical protein